MKYAVVAIPAIWFFFALFRTDTFAIAILAALVSFVAYAAIFLSSVKFDWSKPARNAVIAAGIAPALALSLVISINMMRAPNCHNEPCSATIYLEAEQQ